MRVCVCGCAAYLPFPWCRSGLFIDPFFVHQAELFTHVLSHVPVGPSILSYFINIFSDLYNWLVLCFVIQYPTWYTLGYPQPIKFTPANLTLLRIFQDWLCPALALYYPAGVVSLFSPIFPVSFSRDFGYPLLLYSYMFFSYNIFVRISWVVTG